jgi:hypothetical protein
MSSRFLISLFVVICIIGCVNNLMLSGVVLISYQYDALLEEEMDMSKILAIHNEKNSPETYSLATTDDAAVLKVDTLTARNVTKKKKGGGRTTTKYMWDELTDTQDLCAQWCQVRDPCLFYDWKPSTECYMYQGTAKETTSSLGNSRASTDCGSFCDCPPLTHAPNVMDAESVCALLQNKTVLFSGDSLVRDQFTALGLWILHHVDGVFDLDRIVPPPCAVHDQSLENA